MDRQLLKERNKLYFQIWEKNKNDKSMKRLVEIFKCFPISLQSLYRILENEAEKK